MLAFSFAEESLRRPAVQEAPRLVARPCPLFHSAEDAARRRSRHRPRAEAGGPGAPGLRNRGRERERGRRSRARKRDGGQRRRGAQSRGPRGMSACWTIQLCIAIAAAAATLIERVEPNWVMPTTRSAASRILSLTPGPSWPTTSTHRRG